MSDNKSEYKMISQSTILPPDQAIAKIATLPHPRIMASSAQFATLIAEANSGNGIRSLMKKRIIAIADSLLPKPPLTRILTGRRLLGISRDALIRIPTFSLAYLLTEDSRYLERAKSEMLSIAAFSDWNPSHFLDTAEMTLAMSTGYDWLYNYLDNSTRATISTAIIHKGLRAEPLEADSWWRKAKNNWGQVCHSGMLAGSVAVAELDPQAAAFRAKDAIEKLPISMEAFAPNGGYPEGPAYWGYGAGYNAIGLAILEHAFGTSYGLCDMPGVNKTGLYMDITAGPSSQMFNFADCAPSRRSLQPAIWWYSKRFNSPGQVEVFERKILESELAKNSDKLIGGWYYAYMFLWYYDKPAGATPETLPLTWESRGRVPIAIIRTGYTKNSAFFGIKAGKAGVSHGHMDAGSFVFDIAGVRWAEDLECEPYHRIEISDIGYGLWNLEQNSRRWELYRLNNYSHNTLTLNDALHDVKGEAKFLTVSENPLKVVIDLAPALQPHCDTAIRTFELKSDTAAIITDELTGLQPSTKVVWGLSTKATPEIAGDKMILRLNGKTLTLTATTGTWNAFSIAEPRGKNDSPNPDYNRIELTNIANNSTFSLRITLNLGE